MYGTNTAHSTATQNNLVMSVLDGFAAFAGYLDIKSLDR